MQGAFVGNTALPAIRLGATQKVAVGSGSVASAVIGAHVVRLLSTVDCHIAFGSAPVADANAAFLPASTPEYFVADPADKVAVIRESSDGSLYVTAAA